MLLSFPENVLRKRFHHHITLSPPLEPDNHLHRTLLLEEDQQLDSTNTDERIVRLGETPVSLAVTNIHESDEIPQSDEAVRSDEGADVSQKESSIIESNKPEGSTPNNTNTKMEENTSINPVGTTSTPVLKKVVVLTLSDFYNKDMEEFKNRIDAQKKEVADLEVNTVESDPPVEVTTPYSKVKVENTDEPGAVHITFVSEDITISLPSEDSNKSSVGNGNKFTENKDNSGEFLTSGEGSGTFGETYTTSATPREEITDSVTEISLNKNFSMSDTLLSEEEFLREITTEHSKTRNDSYKFTLVPDEHLTLADEGVSEESAEGTSYMSDNSALTTEESIKDLDSTISSETENKVEEELLLKDLNYNYRQVNTDSKIRTDSAMHNSNVDITTESKPEAEPTTEMDITSQEFIPSNIYVRVVNDVDGEKVGSGPVQGDTTPQEDITTVSDVTEGYTSVNNSNVIDHIGKASELFLSSVSEEEDEDEAGGEWKDLTTDNIVYLYDKTDSYPTTIDAFPINKSSTTEENDSKESSASFEPEELKTISLPETTTPVTLVEDTTQEISSLNIKKQDEKELVSKENLTVRKENMEVENDPNFINVTNVENINKTQVMNNYKTDVTEENPQFLTEKNYPGKTTSDVDVTTVILNEMHTKEIDNSSPMATEDSVQTTKVFTQEEGENMEHTPIPTEYMDSNTEFSNVGSETMSNNDNLTISETSSTSAKHEVFENEKSPEINVADQFIREEPPVLLFKGDMALQQMDVVVAEEMENIYHSQNKENGKNTRSESENDNFGNTKTNEGSNNGQQNKPLLILKPVIKKNNSENSKLFEGDDMEGYINDTPLNKDVEILSKDGKVQEVIKVQEGSSHKTMNDKPELPISLPTHPDAEFIGTIILSATPETTVVAEERMKESTDMAESESTEGQTTSLSPNTSEQFSSEQSTQLFIEQVTDGYYTKTGDMPEKSDVKILPDVITFRSNISLDKNYTESRLEAETTEVSIMSESWLKEGNNSDTNLGEGMKENSTNISYKEETTIIQEIQETTEALNKNYFTEKVEGTEISDSETNSTYTTETETAENNFTTEPIQVVGTADERNVRSNPESESDDAVDNADLLILQDFFRKLYRNQVSENVSNH